MYNHLCVRVSSMIAAGMHSFCKSNFYFKSLSICKSEREREDCVKFQLHMYKHHSLTKTVKKKNNINTPTFFVVNTFRTAATHTHNRSHSHSLITISYIAFVNCVIKDRYYIYSQVRNLNSLLIWCVWSSCLDRKCGLGFLSLCNNFFAIYYLTSLCVCETKCFWIYLA